MDRKLQGWKSDMDQKQKMAKTKKKRKGQII